MIDGGKIVFGEPLYFTSDYSGATKISIIRLFDDGEALVKQYCKEKDFKPFTRPMAYIYDNRKDAEKGRRAWESYVRRQKREEIEVRFGDTIINGNAGPETVRQHERISENMVNDFARLLGVKW